MKTKQILKVMQIFAWIAFIGLSIKVGAIVISYIVSLGNPEASKNLNEDMNYFDYNQYSIMHYTFIVFYRILQYSLQAGIAFLVIKLLSNLNIQRPFNTIALKQIQTISYNIIALWAIVVIHNFHVGILEARSGIKANLLSSEFVLLAGVVFVISLLFKRGLELQSENDLTI